MLSDILLPELPQQLEEERIKWLRDMDKPESIIRGQKPYQRIFRRWSKGIPFTKALGSMPARSRSSSLTQLSGGFLLQIRANKSHSFALSEQ